MGRRIYLINPSFQMRFIGFMAVIALITVLVFYASNLLFFYNFIKIGQDLNFPPDHPFFRFIAEQKRIMTWIFGLTSGLALVTIVVGGLMLSNRVAGPLYRFRTHLERIAESGAFDEVTFRKGDFFPELAQTFNRYMKRLKGRSIP